MTWVNRWCTLAVLAALVGVVTPGVAHAQGESLGRIAGTVVDSQSAQPLPNTRVSVVGTPLQALTDASGNFTISGVASGRHTVRAQRLGFRPSTQSVTVGAGATATISFRLAAQAIQLQSVVTVGYGTQQRRDVTGAVSTVTTQGLEKAPITSVDQLLQGTSPGVQVTTSSSEPGGALSVRIRGTSSITGNSEPLYVIDGFPIENDIEGSSVGNGGRSRTTPPDPLVALNPNDIESMTILKDASATAIYGARGANGVVIITTKQGHGTRPQFSLDTYYGVQSVAKRYDLLNAEQYMDYANAYGENSSTPFTPFPDSVKAAILASGINTDWQSQIFRTAPVRDVEFAVRGATNNASPTRYALSIGNFDQEGIVVGSGLHRVSGRFNLDQSLGSRFEVGGMLTAAQARTKSVPTAGQQNANAGAVSAALQYVPILPVKNPDGTYSYIYTDLNAYNALLNAPQTPNPVSLAREVQDSLGDTRVLTNVFGQAKLFPDLTLKVTLGMDYADRFRYTYYPRTTLQGQQSNGDAIRATRGTSSWLNENTLTYDKTFGSQHINLLGGYTQQRTTSDGSSMENTNFVSDITGYYDIGAGTQTGGPTIGSSYSAQTLQSWLSRLNYQLLDRYLLTLTYRADGSSRFAADRKWGSFPSAAVGWRVSSEPWFQRFSWITDLKLRGSYGLAGNPSIRPYQSLARLNSQGYSFGGTPVAGYYVTAVGNPDLTWETTRQTDGGLDLTAWNRVSLTADYYRKRTTNLLLQISLPYETGFESALANRGSVENRGFELGLDADIIRGDGGNGFTWHTNLNYATNHNKVLDLGGQQRIFADLLTTDYNLPGTLVQVGQPLGVFYGFKSAGVIRDSAEAAAITYKNFSGKAFQPGQVKIVDTDGDGVITLNDQTIIGDPTPDYTYGMTNTFSFHNLQLTAMLQGSHGGKILNVNRIRTEGSPRVNVSVDRYLNSWTPTNTNAKYPSIGENPNQVGPNTFTSDLLESGSFLRLRSLTLAWTLPNAFTRSTRASSAQLYVTGNNLFTITDYSGFNPDVSSESVNNLNRGVDIGAYPLARSVTGGVRLTF